MTARRVLVVAYDFPPHAAIGTMRTLRVVRQLHARGWDVTVLTGDPSRYRPSTPVDPALLARVPEGVRVIRAGAVRPWDWAEQAIVGRLRGARAAGAGGMTAPRAAAPTTPSKRHPIVERLARAKEAMEAGLSIPDRESGWLLPALGSGAIEQLRAARADVIYSSAPPWTGQIVAAGLARLFGRPWVADFRDPWSRAPYSADRRHQFVRRAAARLERYVVQHADRIVFVARGNRDDFIAQYGAALAERSDVVPNGCDPAEFDGLRHLHPPEHGPHVMLHAGSLYGGRSPISIFEAIAAAIARGGIDRSRFRLRFLGANAFTAVDLPGACRALGIGDVVEFHPRVPREESLRAMMTASSLLLLQPGHTVSVPGKVYEYLATGRPIFAIAEEGEAAEVVRESGQGLSVTPGEAEAIVRALETFVRDTPASTVLPARHLFDGTIGAARIAGILEDLVPGGPHRVLRERGDRLTARAEGRTAG